MNKETLIKMVELDTLEVKKDKLIEEITELRFGLIAGKRNNIIEEIAQVNFVLYQLESVGICFRKKLDEMLKKYDLVNEYRKYVARNWHDIQEREKIEYTRNCRRLKLNEGITDTNTNY